MLSLTTVAAIDLAAERIKARRAGKSDVTPEIADALAVHSDGWDEAYRVDTSRGLDHSVLVAQNVGAKRSSSSDFCRLHGRKWGVAAGLSEGRLAIEPGTNSFLPRQF